MMISINIFSYKNVFLLKTRIFLKYFISLSGCFYCYESWKFLFMRLSDGYRICKDYELNQEYHETFI